jgi:transcriptional regulator GlxA family with amidase domain
MKLETIHDESGDCAVMAEAPEWSDSYAGRQRYHERRATVDNCDIPGIRKAIRTIRHEYSRPLTVSSLARECGMSVRSLHRLYRSVTGTTIGQDLIARRIEAAASMLREDDVKLEPVAMETGLGNAKNLCRLFKEHLGLTPGQWKESFHGRRAGAA